MCTDEMCVYVTAGSKPCVEASVDVVDPASRPEVWVECKCFQCEHRQLGDHPERHLEFLPVRTPLVMN